MTAAPDGLDHTHDPAATSWVEGADGHAEFPIQNLPLGVFAPAGREPRIGTAIGDSILDLRALSRAGVLPGAVADALEAADLKPLLALGAEPARALRHRVFDLLARTARPQAAAREALHAAADCTLLLPARPCGYTDFYAGIVHATNVGRLLRPDNPLMPNYRHVPIGYHGRTSSVVVSGAEVIRPWGQVKDAAAAAPDFRPSARLDYEVELGFWLRGGNARGAPIPIRDARDHLAGVTLLNDWSARDIQAWEYQPLGPFLAKNFASTVSPWLVTAEALAPFWRPQRPRGADEPRPLPYLDDAQDAVSGALDIAVDVALLTAAMRAAGAPPQRIGRTHAQHLYWTAAQMIAHHSSNGCPLEPGDLLGTGTISAPDVAGFGSLMEVSRGGTEPVTLANGERRAFLEDGDEVVMTGRCRREGFATIGFGACRGVIREAVGEQR